MAQMVLFLIALSVVAILVLAYQRAPIWSWALAALLIGAMAGYTVGGNWFGVLAPAVILGLMSIPGLRMLVLTGPAYGMVKRILPRVSRTEQEALDAGTV